MQTPQIGSLGDHINVDGTFLGSRVMKSFDPSKLTCISCNKEHPVVRKVPAVYFFTDQNFVASLNCDNGGCINIVRVENATQTELYYIVVEIFGNTTFPEGSVPDHDGGRRK